VLNSLSRHVLSAHTQRDNLNISAVFEAVVRQMRKTGNHGRKLKDSHKKKCVIL
jgi:hypothetical protein